MRLKKNKDKVVLITGASQGIGKEVAFQFCEAGNRVVINSRNGDKLLNVKQEFEGLGLSVKVVQGDVTIEADCKNIIQQVVRMHGRIDVLINNASLAMNESLSNIDIETYQSVFQSNSIGASIPTLMALPYLKKTKGSVVFMSSLAGLHSMPLASAYSSGKMALTSFWQSLRLELRYTGIHFGICYISFTKNDENKRMLAANGKEVKVPFRPKIIQQSQQKVARKILKMVEQRKAKVTFSVLGKIAAFTIQYFPKFFIWVMSLFYQFKQNKT